MAKKEDRSICEELSRCMEYLHLMLDNESTRAQDEYVTSHLEKCSQCFEQYEVEKQIREVLQAKLAHRPVPANLAAEIRSKIIHPSDS